MLSEEGKERLQQFIPNLWEDKLNYYANDSKLTDEMVDTLIDHYSEQFTNNNFKEKENLLIGLMNGVSLSELNHCVDICMKNKQKPPYLHYKTDKDEVDTSETIRLYCFAYKNGESLDDIWNLDNMVECLGKAENLAECYNVGTGVSCSITDISDLDCYCLTPNHLEGIFDCSDNLNKPTIGTVYYADFENLRISGEIMPDYPDKYSVSPMDLNDGLDPFIVRQFNSFKSLSAKIKECYNSGFIARSLNITRSEINKAIQENNKYMNKDYSYKDIAFSTFDDVHEFNTMYLEVESKNKKAKKSKSTKKAR